MYMHVQSHTWAARYNTWLLTAKVIVVISMIFCFYCYHHHHCCYCCYCYYGYFLQSPACRHSRQYFPSSTIPSSVSAPLQVNSENQAIAKQQHWESVGKHLPQAFVAATEPLDIPNMPLVKQIQADYAAAKPAMLRHMAHRKRLVLAKQMEIASRYNAKFEQLHQHDAGATSL